MGRLGLRRKSSESLVRPFGSVLRCDTRLRHGLHVLLSRNKNKGEARLGREREQKANFCLTAYAVRGIWVPNGIRVSTGYAVPPLENPDPSHPIRGPAAARSSISRRRVRRRRDPQKQLTARPALERFEGMSREEVEFFAAFEMTGERFRPGFLCRILARRRTLRQAGTKSELLLARLRRSWHIRLQWNSCGCRRRLRPARPSLEKSRSFQSGPGPPALHRASFRRSS